VRGGASEFLHTTAQIMALLKIINAEATIDDEGFTERSGRPCEDIEFVFSGDEDRD